MPVPIKKKKYRLRKYANGGSIGDPQDLKKLLHPHEVANWSSKKLKEYLGEEDWGKIQEAMRKYPMDVDHNALNVERYADLNDPDDVDYDPERYIKKTTPEMGRSRDIFNVVEPADLLPKDKNNAYGENFWSRVARELEFAPYNDIKLLKSRTIKQDPVDKELQASTTSIPTSKRNTELMYKLNANMRTGQEPDKYKVWDEKGKKWRMRDVEPEELEYYRNKNKIQERQNIKASFNHGGKFRLLKK